MLHPAKAHQGKARPVLAQMIRQHVGQTYNPAGVHVGY
jgi:hypothetical protein